MAKKRIRSKPGLFGFLYHYDENGKFVGKSRPSLMGDGKVHYDSSGKQVGISRPGVLLKEVYHDEENNRYISSCEGLIGEAHFDSGTPIGVSHAGICGAEFTILDVDKETEEEVVVGDVLMEYGEEQKFSESDGNNRTSIITNIIVFVLCFVIVGILMLIFK